MTSHWVAAPLSTVRHVIADVLMDSGSVDERIGEVVLRAHQCRAAERLVSIITKQGGAMLAEPVGVGKTYTALAVASHFGGIVLVVTPASLREMWRDAARRASLDVSIVTYEALSRGSMPDLIPDFIIADESHRLRSPGTRRYALLADLARRARLLLVTATPVHNRRDDLAAQLALFAGRSVWQWSEEALTELVVRDTGSMFGARPRLDGPHRVVLDADDDCLDQLVALPAPIPARDESVAATLIMFGLLHQWTSSRAALVAALQKRRARGLALIAALESGRRPTRNELAAWTHAGDALQLAFPEIIASNAPVDVDNDALLIAVDRHNAAVAALLTHLRTTNDPDDARAAALRRIRRTHPGERIIAFCQYTETVGAMWARLSRESGIAALTAAGARVAGGPLSREAVIAQFAPDTPRRTADRDRIDLLVTTDLLSEGLNLQEASVIVHLDLPWNPARLDQRTGRALRLGSRHASVTVYTLAPPVSAERLIGIEARLREKLRVAQRTIGVAGRILPSGMSDTITTEPGLAEQRGTFAATMRDWRLGSERVPARDSCIVATVCARQRGYLALVRTSSGPMLVANAGSGIETSLSALSAAIAACSLSENANVRESRVAGALRELERWLSVRRAATTIDLGAVTAARARRATLARVAQALARAPRHRRPALAPLAAAARAVASAPLAEGAERILETLAGAALPDEAWLRSIAAFGNVNTRPIALMATRHDAPEVIAVIVFDPANGEL